MKIITSLSVLLVALLLPPSLGLSTDIEAPGTRPLNQDDAIGVRKMTADEGEKFFFDYWDFGSLPGVSSVNMSSLQQRSEDQSESLRNLKPALALHTESESRGSFPNRARRALSMLLGRDFKCPTNTFSCTSIGQPDSCCGDGDTCEIVQDTGLGTVGCCPAGETCGNTVSSCANGYTSCPSNLGGGCCIPGYMCVTGGCVFVSTYTVTQQSTTFVASSTISTVTVEPTTLSTSSSSTTTTRLSTTTSTTSTATSTASSTTTSTTSSTTISPVPPVRPTTDSQTTITSSATSSSSTAASVCPTGFYACSAVYEGGCCRTGRDCDTTSCPATSSTTIINSDGVTIAVPTGSAATTATEGSCATGWFSCAASAGGGCCPSGFACGSSCTASASGTATATAVVGKEQPGGGARKIANLYSCGLFVLGTLCFAHWIF